MHLINFNKNTKTYKYLYLYVKFVAEMRILVLFIFHFLHDACRGQLRGGHPAQQKQFPFSVQIHLVNCVGGNCACGGTIIAPRFVITAAHCVRTQGSNRRVYVVAGDVSKRRDPNPKEDYPRVEIETEKIKVIHHSGYDDDQYKDLALLFIQTPFRMNDHVQQIGLSEEDEEGDKLKVGDACTVMGYGRTRIDGENKQRDPSPHLKYAELKVDYLRKEAVFFKLEREGESAYTMLGDSGSPLVCADSRGNKKLYGVYRGADNNYHYARYTRIKKFKKWIESKMEIAESKYPAARVYSNYPVVVYSTCLAGFVVAVMRFFVVQFLH